jgi:HAD superfamily hydrolase (TIGR01509 family)
VAVAPGGPSPAAMVFDLDGTLVLTEHRNAQVWRAFFGQHDMDVDAELLHRLQGRRGIDSLTDLAHRFPTRTLQELAAEVADIETAIPLDSVQLVAGARDVVTRLATGGMPLALVTSGGRSYAQGLLAELGLFDSFSVVVVAEDVSAGKPDPQGYLTACSRLGVNAADAVGFEDSPAGVAAVKAAGMRCVAVATTVPRDQLAAADVVLDDFTSLDELEWPPLATAAPGKDS